MKSQSLNKQTDTTDPEGGIIIQGVILTPTDVYTSCSNMNIPQFQVKKFLR